MNNFDMYVGIDWSGAKSPIKSSSISVAYVDRGNFSPVILSHLNSRHEIALWIQEKAQETKRILIGIDCNFGYAREVGHKHFGQNYNYKDVWSEVDRTSHHLDNFYAEGFWTHSQYRDDFWITGTQREDFKIYRRQTEIACQRIGLGVPESPFKLIGAKQVGKGGLAGMRLANFLTQQLGSTVCFWPFETSQANQAKIVVTEIYPRLFIRLASQKMTKIRCVSDLNQILSYFQTDPYDAPLEINDHQADALISAVGLRFLCGSKTTIPDSIAIPFGMTAEIAVTEGWIFGVT
ncbi:MAG: hypothetical protein J0L77_02305 [Alphaproteobacteria bacterium]|nr:hypothetical protein [Alphaproteobacteria bacterium]